MTVISLEALRLAKDIPALDPEGYTRAAANPVNPPPELELKGWPEDDIIEAYKLTSWYLRETEDGMEQAALYVARKFGLSLAHAWDQVECSYADYNATYSHN
ncbi:hypothetical protein [Microvirga sp. G4-2]|uniref:hypothetical protein n=1 Tax=Microvirga sp. G4-2 TaxID=3434467 RepID=UPI00404490DA